MTTQLSCAGSRYLYSCTGNKPQLLLQLESSLNKELKVIDPNEPKHRELELQVYSNVFGRYITAFTTYQPLLSAIKKVYECNLAAQQQQLQALEPLRSRLRLLTEDCDRTLQARWGEEQAEIRSLKRENQQMKKEIEEAKEKERSTQALVDHLQSEVAKQYLQYRDECDARKLLIWQLNDLTKGSTKEEDRSCERSDLEDPVTLHAALRVCREDLSKAQEELTKLRAEYWDVVPRRDWDVLQDAHKQTLTQLETLQHDFNHLKTKYDSLLEVQPTDMKQSMSEAPVNLKEDPSPQSPTPSSLTEPSDPELNTPCLQETREPVKTAESEEEEPELLYTSSIRPHLSSI